MLAPLLLTQSTNYDLVNFTLLLLFVGWFIKSVLSISEFRLPSLRLSLEANHCTLTLRWPFTSDAGGIETRSIISTSWFRVFWKSAWALVRAGRALESYLSYHWNSICRLSVSWWFETHQFLSICGNPAPWSIPYHRLLGLVIWFQKVAWIDFRIFPFLLKNVNYQILTNIEQSKKWSDIFRRENLFVTSSTPPQNFFLHPATPINIRLEKVLRQNRDK